MGDLRVGVIKMEDLEGREIEKRDTGDLRDGSEWDWKAGFDGKEN